MQRGILEVSRVKGVRFKTAVVTTLAVAQLYACAGSKTVVPANLPNISANAVQALPQITSADVKRIAAWGSKGKIAIAQCPQGYKVIGGGSSSSDGSFVGTGYAGSNHTAWLVKPDSSASAESFATCASRAGAGKYFLWRSAAPTSGLAAAQCHVGYTLVTGYGTGTVSTSWFAASTNTFWVGGGGTAYASCVRNGVGIVIKHAWNTSQKPKNVFAGCGTSYTVIAGSMGDNAWPGPPVQEHPGLPSSPGQHGYRGWWTFSNAQNELTWAACVRS